MATKIRDLMTTDPVVLDSSATAADAAQRMRQDDVGNVLVEEDGQLRGIVTDRDLVVRVLAEGTDAASISLGQVCSSDLDTLGPDDDLDAAVELLRDDAVRRIPVVEDGTAVGILSLGDLAIERDGQSALAEISVARGNT
ncbi:CBS domain-containing protein [Nitriliruptoraceae bacterium ZYF776]|nr:CBS domain-containing protein [Profundirhabdus halotolerans]